MKKTFLAAIALYLFLPNLPLQSVPAPTIPDKKAAFVVDANRYAWAWADANYYTCFSITQENRLSA